MVGEEDDISAGLYRWCLLTLYLIAPPTFLSLQFISAPYGRHRRPGWGPSTIPASLAWFLMEGPTLYLSLLLFPLGRHRSSLRSISLLSVFLLHYSHRTIVYPLRLRATKPSSDSFPISVALMAFVFNLLNAYVQARWVSHYGSYDADMWFWTRFVVGLGVFVAGMAVNVWADSVLVRLKAESGGGYRVPRGGLYELVSCPNYLGEMVEWLGWAIMTWSWAGLGFFLYTGANLVPRGRANHVWYLDKFGEDYPKHRKAVIPFLY